jgi:hypothetical protein
MKRLILLLVVAATLISCAMPNKAINSVSRNSFTGAEVAPEDIKRADYEIIGDVESTSIVEQSMDYTKKIITEKTGLFTIEVMGRYANITSGKLTLGNIGDLPKGTQTQYVDSGCGNVQAVQRAFIPTDAEEIAYRVACYSLIEKAKAMGADMVIFPNAKTEIEVDNIDVAKMTVTATITAKAIKLK